MNSNRFFTRLSSRADLLVPWISLFLILVMKIFNPQPLWPRLLLLAVCPVILIVIEATLHQDYGQKQWYEVSFNLLGETARIFVCLLITIDILKMLPVWPAILFVTITSITQISVFFSYRHYGIPIWNNWNHNLYKNNHWIALLTFILVVVMDSIKTSPHSVYNEMFLLILALLGYAIWGPLRSLRLHLITYLSERFNRKSDITRIPFRYLPSAGKMDVSINTGNVTFEGQDCGISIVVKLLDGTNVRNYFSFDQILHLSITETSVLAQLENNNLKITVILMDFIRQNSRIHSVSGLIITSTSLQNLHEYQLIKS